MSSQFHPIVRNLEQKWKASTVIHAKLIQHALKSFYAEQHKQFFANCSHAPIQELVEQRSAFIDQIVALIWKQYQCGDQAALIAVGGYGRQELFPFSDIDLLIVPHKDSSKSHQKSVEKFIRLLWDIGLKVGSNVRSLEQCKKSVTEDIKIMTSTLESRFLSGNWECFQQFKTILDSKIIEDSNFVERKKLELKLRHGKYNDTIYLLEPNVKESPSGLRDIHTIMWIVRAAIGFNQFEQLLEEEYLSITEYQNFKHAKNFLWRFRFILHLLNKRDENRLLFEHQVAIAQKFGYKKNKHQDAVELCMQDYYKELIIIRRTRFLLLQRIDEQRNCKKTPQITILNRRFQIRDKVMETRHPNVFKRYPFALLEIFLLMQNNLQLRDFSSQTSRQMINDLEIIDDKFRNDYRNKALFMEIIRQKEGVHWALHSMHEHGVLGAYIPEFFRVEGLMQFDLFHTYTVDAHTLLTIRNILLFFNDSFVEKPSLEHPKMPKIAKPELLVLTALLHDIAKGREGQHEKIGATIALNFCRNHYLSLEDSFLVSWLVRNHLELSTTAQKMDIYDPSVLQLFINRIKIKKAEHLDYLYLFTIADITATAPNLLNEFKRTLIHQLWHLVKRKIHDSNETLHSINVAKKVAKIKESIVETIHNQDISKEKINQFLNHWDNDYFTKQSFEQIVQQVKFILSEKNQDMVVKVDYNRTFRATELLIWVRRKQFQFATITACIDQQNYSVIQARVRRDLDNFVLYSFLLESLANEKEFSFSRAKELEDYLHQKLMASMRGNYKFDGKPKKRMQDRRIKNLLIKTEISFEENSYTEVTTMNLITRDRPGLLALVSKTLGNLKVLVVGAYVSTVGGRVDDKLLLLDKDQQPVSTLLKKKIFQRLQKIL